MMDDVARKIYLKYKNALIYIGVDLSNDSVIECIEYCNYDLETRFQAIIAYWYWLKDNEREIINSNQILINAFYKEWKPIGWREEFLKDENFKSPAQKWWDKARKIDILNSLIIDVVDNFWSGGKIFFKVPSREPLTMDLERAMDMNWSDILEHYQRVTGIIIETHPGRFLLLREERNFS